MEAADKRATIVVCARVTGTTGGRRSDWPRLDRSAVPVTWIAAWDTLAEQAAAGRLAGQAVALDLPAGAIESRQRMRSLVARGREAVPLLDTVAVHAELERSHRDLLIDEGVRAVLVDHLAGEVRSSRRPAPRGWRCRNTAWGLWEVEAARTRSRGLLTWLGQGFPRVRARSLLTISTEALMNGGGGKAFLHPRLERCLEWATKQVARGAAEPQTVPGLVARLSGDERQPLAGSVLRAA